MGPRAPKVIIPTATDMTPYLEKVHSEAPRTAYNVQKTDKRGARLYGKDRIKNVLKEFLARIANIDGRLGFTDKDLEELQAFYDEFSLLPTLINDINAMKQIYEDSQQYRLHQVNVVFERASRALDNQPEYADLFPTLLDHVRSAGKQAVKTRKANQAEKDKKEKEAQDVAKAETPLEE